MNKMIFLTYITLFCQSVFGGWTTQEMKDAYEDVPTECLIFDVPIAFNGEKQGDNIWICCDIEANAEKTEFHRVGNPKTTVQYTYTGACEFGTFDDTASFNAWVDQFKKSVYDDFEEAWVEVYMIGEDSVVINEDIKNVWNDVYNDNKANMQVAMEKVESNISKYLNDLAEKEKGSGGGSGGGGGESPSITDKEAEDIAEIIDAVKEQEESYAEKAKETQDKVSDVVEKLNESAEDLSKFDTEKEKEVHEKVESAADVMDNAISDLDEAVNNNDFNALAKINDNLDDTISALTDAMTALSDLPASEYTTIKNEIINAIGVINGAKLNITRSKNEHNMAYARTALSALRGLSGLSRVKMSVAHAILMHKKASGIKGRYDLELETLLLLINMYTDLQRSSSSMRLTIHNICSRYITDMNKIGSYLGSTNAMEYFRAKRDISEMEPDDIMRWFGFSSPEPLKNNPSFYDDFNVGGKNWYTVYHNFQSEYFTQAMPIGSLEVLLSHFNMPSVSMNKYRGFYEQDDYTPGEVGHVTNWYANRITAPKNWADGTTIICTNGKYRAQSSGIYVSGTDGSTAFCTNGLVFASADDSNVKVSVTNTPDGKVKITIGVNWKAE